MTRVFQSPDLGKRPTCRVLALGVSSYPHASTALGLPELRDISSAGLSAAEFATKAIMDWSDRLARPLGSVDLLLNSPDRRDGGSFTVGDQLFEVDAPTLPAIRQARDAWLQNATADDMLVFYCCGHGSRLPEQSRMFFAADWGLDAENPWLGTISLDGFARGIAEKKPRLQWLIFDTCAAVEPGSSDAADISVDPLIAGRAGNKGLASRRNGPLERTIVASSVGSTAVGKPGETSRMLTMFIEACSGSGITSSADGDWWVDHDSVQMALRTYADRIAAPGDREFFVVPLDVQSDSVTSPRFMRALGPPRCTLIVQADPVDRLKGCAVSIADATSTGIASRLAGPDATATYRTNVPSWAPVYVDVHFPTGVERREEFPLPPLLRSRFRVNP